jgi:hypothetical protein
MKPIFLSALTVVGVASLACWSPLAGQWVVGVEVGSYRFWGGSAEGTPEQRSFRPFRPTTFGVEVERRSGKLGIGLLLRYAEAGLALEGEDAVVAVDGIFKIYGGSAEIVYQIASVGSHCNLLLHAGPLVELWSIIDEDSKVYLGVQSAVSLNIPFGRHMAGSLRVGGALSPSPFTREQLEPGFEPRTLWRRGVAARVEYRL